jgi:DMSO/TMAO reductase YedYZ molybdopterin-dependent catalytic subunit
VVDDAALERRAPARPRRTRRGAGAVLRVESLQPRGALRRVTLGHAQHTDERALLALRVNGADLSLDHGFPARIVVPALPGVHCTKWVASLTWTAS